VTGNGRPTVSRLALNLFPNVVLTAIFERSENINPGRAWIGSIQGAPMSVVTLTVVGRELAGSVTYPGGIYEISGDATGMAIVAEVDATRLAPPAEPLRRPGSSAISSSDAGLPASEALVSPAVAIPEITVAIFYTARAQSEAGGATTIQARISNRVATANAAYRNSGINQRIKLVHSGPIAYTQSGSPGTHLTRLRTVGDGHMESVHVTRNSKKADLVALVVGGSSWNYGACGIGYLFVPPINAPSMAPYGFSWNVLECLSVYVLEHEMGHNMGAHHDSYVTGGSHGAYPYSHGYVDLAARFLTIMAYDNQCHDKKINCKLIGYFSNPAKKYGTRATGKAAADNGKTLNKTAAIVAAFR
jgi:hypothetical protein